MVDARASADDGDVAPASSAKPVTSLTQLYPRLSVSIPQNGASGASRGRLLAVIVPFFCVAPGMWALPHGTTWHCHTSESSPFGVVCPQPLESARLVKVTWLM